MNQQWVIDTGGAEQKTSADLLISNHQPNQSYSDSTTFISLCS